ncbi:MAG: hypothetical protein ACYDBQ_01280 [Thermoplasmatota archaeon]
MTASPARVFLFVTAMIPGALAQADQQPTASSSATYPKEWRLVNDYWFNATTFFGDERSFSVRMTIPSAGDYVWSMPESGGVKLTLPNPLAQLFTRFAVQETGDIAWDLTRTNTTPAFHADGVHDIVFSRFFGCDVGGIVDARVSNVSVTGADRCFAFVAMSVDAQNLSASDCGWALNVLNATAPVGNPIFGPSHFSNYDVVHVAPGQVILQGGRIDCAAGYDIGLDQKSSVAIRHTTWRQRLDLSAGILDGKYNVSEQFLLTVVVHDTSGRPVGGPLVLIGGHG